MEEQWLLYSRIDKQWPHLVEPPPQQQQPMEESQRFNSANFWVSFLALLTGPRPKLSFCGNIRIKHLFFWGEKKIFEETQKDVYQAVVIVFQSIHTHNPPNTVQTIWMRVFCPLQWCPSVSQFMSLDNVTDWFCTRQYFFFKWYYHQQGCMFSPVGVDLSLKCNKHIEEIRLYI